MRRICLLAAVAAVLLPSPPAGAGGGGEPLVVTAVHGRAEMRYPGGPWRPAKRGEVMGRIYLRTGRGSWVHVRCMAGRACVDSRSLVRIDSGCGARVEALRGRLSAVDGRRGPSLGRVVWF